MQNNNNLLISSNGTHVHPTVDGIANFKKWFKNSKVKNQEGNPQIMYHGTLQSFDTFDKNKIGSRFCSDNEGFFAISCPKIASEYAEYEEGLSVNTPNVIPLFISLQNPLIIDKHFLKLEGMAEIGIRDCVIDFWDNYQDLILTWSDERKSDGVLLIDSSKLKSDEFIMMSVAFNAKQLKSAIGNSGSFNPKSASLTDSQELALQLVNKNEVIDNNLIRKKMKL